MVAASVQERLASLVCLLLCALLPGSDSAFSFTKTPDDPTVVVVGHNSTRVALEWEYTASGGETIGQMKIQRLNNNISLPEDLATKFNPQRAGKITDKFSKDGHFEYQETATLVINSVTTADEFLYRCQVVTDVNETPGHRNDITLSILVLPKVTEAPQTQVVYEKDNFTLHCVASGKPTPVIRWFKDGEHVGNGPHYNETATKSGTYVYKCEVDNGIGGPTSASATVTVKTPVLSNVTMAPFNGTLKVKEGSPLFLKCAVNADPTPKWTWSKDGTQIPDRKIKGATDNVTLLEIDAVDNEDAGRYTCIAKNRKEEASDSRMIHVTKHSGKEFNVGVQLRITNKVWDAKYGNKESQEFGDLTKKLNPELWLVYREKFESLVKVEVFKLSEGSVVAHVRLTFDEEVSEDAVAAVLKDDQDGQLGPFTFDKNAVKSISPDDPDRRSGCSPDPCVHGSCEEQGNGYQCSCDSLWKGTDCDDPWLIILLAVVLSVVIVLVVIGICRCCCWAAVKAKLASLCCSCCSHERDHKCRTDCRVEDGESLKVRYANNGPEPEGQYATVQSGRGSGVTTGDQYESVGGRDRGRNEPPPAYAAVQQSAPPEQYAVVDKTKKKKKPAQGELMYADVSTGPRQPGSSAPTKPPRQQEPTTYADINFRKSGNDDML